MWPFRKKQKEGKTQINHSQIRQAKKNTHINLQKLEIAVKQVEDAFHESTKDFSKEELKHLYDAKTRHIIRIVVFFNLISGN